MSARLISEKEDRSVVSLSEEASFHYHSLQIRQKVAAFSPDVVVLQTYEQPLYGEETPPNCFSMTHAEMADLISSYQGYLARSEAAIAAAGRENDEEPF